jgi:RND family efflux transporter MFP subunit
MVNAGTSMMSLIDASHVEIETELPAALYLRQKQFTGYSCRTTLFPDREFSLALSSVNHKSSGNQLHKMILTPTSQDASALTPGMSVEVNVMISNDNESGGFTLPVSAVFMSDEKSCVWVVNEQSGVRKRKVQVGGLNSEGRIIVRSGITASDNVVVSGVRALNENDSVRVIENPSATNVGGML